MAKLEREAVLPSLETADHMWLPGPSWNVASPTQDVLQVQKTHPLDFKDLISIKKIEIGYWCFILVTHWNITIWM